MKRTALLVAMMAMFAMAASAMAQDNSGMTLGSGSAPPQVSQPPTGGVNWGGVGVGAGTVAGNILYVPAKLVYGILGGIAGGATYVLTGGNTQTANTVWRSSLGGDYVLTPDMVSGKEPIHFSGPTNTPADNGANGPASSMPAESNSPSTASAPTTMAPQPIDRGTGPVSGNAPAAANAPPLPNTTVE